MEKEKAPDSRAKRIRKLKVQREALALKIGPSYSVSEAAAIFGVKAITVRKWINRKILVREVDYWMSPTGHYRITGNALKRIVGMK